MAKSKLRKCRKQRLNRILKQKKQADKPQLVPVEDYLSSSDEEDDEESAKVLPDAAKLKLDRPPDIKPGLIMEMHKIRKRPDLNGIVVDVLEKDPGRPRRWKVDFMRGKDRVILSVADKNVRAPTSISDDDAGMPRASRRRRDPTRRVIRSSSSDGFSKVRPKRADAFKRAKSFASRGMYAIVSVNPDRLLVLVESYSYISMCPTSTLSLL